jgi:hypothetical protein
LSEDRQATIAHDILDYASHDEDLYHLTADEREEVRDGLAKVKRRDFAADDTRIGLWKSYTQFELVSAREAALRIKCRRRAGVWGVGCANYQT